MLKIKRDKFRRSRGGNSHFLNIYCANCKGFLLLYQKDGPGPLKRLYLDRIFEPEQLAKWQELNYIKDVPRAKAKLALKEGDQSLAKEYFQKIKELGQAIDGDMALLGKLS